MSATPTQIGPYQVQRELGRGGMGVVYLAHDTRLDRPVALKALPEHLAADADRLARFQREAKVLASLNHPNIAAIYGLEHAGSQQYLVLEFVDGDTLEARLGRGAMPVDEALDAARHIAAALEAAHEKGVIHRDLKPGNVMVSSEGVVKVLDFGLARSPDGAASTSGGAAQADSPTIPSPAPIHSPTIPGAIMGTAGYMSPEQARGKPVDKRSDIFSFGCVLYEMLTGLQPFAGETVTDSLGAILHREPDWAALPSSTPPRIRELLFSCLAKDRKNRLHDIGDARLDVDRALSAREWAGVASSPPGMLPPTARRWREPVRLIIAGLVGVALASIGWIVWRGATAHDAAATLPSPVTRVSIDAPPNMVLLDCLISPDGRTVFLEGDVRAEGGAGPNTFKVCARTLDSFEPVFLSDSGGLMGICFSPDGRWYAMLVPLSPGSGRQRIIKGPVDASSPPVTIAEMPGNTHSESIAWPPGDELLCVHRGTRAISRVGINTGVIGEPITVSVPGANGFVKRVEPLPSGDSVFLVDCSAYGERGFDQTIGVLDMRTKQVRTLVPDASGATYLSTGHLLFSRADTLVAVPFDLDTLSITGGAQVVATGLRTLDSWSNASFSISSNGTLAYLPGGVQGARRTLVSVGLDGKAETWSAEQRAFSLVIPPCPSPDGSRVAVTISNANAIDEIWIIEPDRKATRRLVSLPHADASPLGWMPDGEQLIFSRVGDPDAEDGVYLVRADGSEQPVRVAHGLGRRQRHDIGVPLPDGSAIVVDMLVDGATDLLLVPVPGAAGGAPPAEPKTLLHGATIIVGAAVSLDGKLLAYATPDSEVEQVYVCTLSPDGQLGPRVQASSDSGMFPKWRTTDAEKLELLYVDARGRGMSVPVVSEPRLRVESASMIADGSNSNIGIPNIASMLSSGRLLAVQVGVEEAQPTSACLVLNFIEELKRLSAGAGPTK